MDDERRRPCVVILTAMQQELRPLVRKLSLRPVGAGHQSLGAGMASEDRPGEDVSSEDILWAGDIGEVKVLATVTSIGTRAAARRTERLLDTTVVDHLVVVGVAGGLHDRHPLGHVVAPELVVDRYTSTEHRAASLGTHRLAGRLSTSDELDNTAADIEALLDAGTDVVDMETASIAAVCERHGVPWTAFRAISDRVGDAAIDEALVNLVSPDGSPNPPAIVRLVLTQPWRVPAMARLGRQLSVATNAAADAAIAAIGRHDFPLPPVGA